MHGEVNLVRRLLSEGWKPPKAQVGQVRRLFRAGGRGSRGADHAGPVPTGRCESADALVGHQVRAQ